MTAFQAVDKGSIPLSRTNMRIRNYFFLAIGVTLITASVVYQAEIMMTKGSQPIVTASDKKTLDIDTLNVNTNNSISSTGPSTGDTTQNEISSESEPAPTVPVFKLDVPYYQQQYANSCEAASLRMALAYYGINISDDLEIVKKFGYDPRDKDTINNEWDNPQEMFVGDIDIVGSTKGYGVYGMPVAKAATSYGRDAYYETNITPTFLSAEIKAGHPIILWGYTSVTAPAYTWNLVNGGEVTAFKGEHARLVIGFSGDVDNPLGFYLHDPFNGNKSEYWTSNKLMNQVNAVPGVTNQAVVIK